jgi:hypothetical protein
MSAILVKSPTVDIDFIDLETGRLGDLLAGMAVSCRALARTTEVDDGIARNDVNKALEALAHQLDAIQEGIEAIKNAADTLYGNARPEGGTR